MRGARCPQESCGAFFHEVDSECMKLVLHTGGHSAPGREGLIYTRAAPAAGDTCPPCPGPPTPDRAPAPTPPRPPTLLFLSSPWIAGLPPRPARPPARAPRLLLPRPRSMAPAVPGRAEQGAAAPAGLAAARAALSGPAPRERPPRAFPPPDRMPARRPRPRAPAPPRRSRNRAGARLAPWAAGRPVSRLPHTPAPRPASRTPPRPSRCGPGTHCPVHAPSLPRPRGPPRPGPRGLPLCLHSAADGGLTVAPSSSFHLQTAQTVRTCFPPPPSGIKTSPCSCHSFSDFGFMASIRQVLPEHLLEQIVDRALYPCTVNHGVRGE